MNNSTSAFEKLVQTSMNTIRSSVPSNIGFTIIGFLTVLFSSLQLITIVKDKKLKTRCYFIIANLSFASAAYGVSYIALAAKRWIRLVLNINEVKTKRECALEMFSCYFSQSAVIFLPLATSLDRVLAAAAPMLYKNMSPLWSLLSVGTAWSFALIESAFLFYGNDQQTLVPNCNLVSASDLLYIIPNGIEIGVCLLVVLCYLMVVVFLHKAKGVNAANNKTRLQIKVAKALTIESVVHLITQAASRVGLSALTPLSAEIRAIYAPFIRMLLIIGAGSSLPIFLLVNRDFRRAFFWTFPCFASRTSVVPFTISTEIALNQRQKKENTNCI